MASFSGKQISLAILPKISGSLSFLGSTFIFQDVARSRRRRTKPYNRLILALSTFDIMASIVNIFSTWPIPVEYAERGQVFAAVGTTQTCTAQGFFNETGNITTPLYNCMLCVYYILIIRNGWSEQRVKKIEPYLHILPLCVGWGMGIAGLPLTLYNPSGWLCWYAPYPGNCLNDPSVPCERGGLAFVFRWLHYAIIWSAILFVTVGMFLIYRKVQTNEAKTKRFTQHVHPKKKDAPRPKRRLSFVMREENALREQQAASTRSRKVANQAFLFVGALYTTWTFTTLTRIFQTAQGKTYYPLLVLMAIFFPLQGFFNAIIYLRPRYLKSKKEKPEKWLWSHCMNVITNKEKERRDNTEYSVSASGDNRRSFVSKVSSVIKDRRLSFLSSNVGETSEVVLENGERLPQAPSNNKADGSGRNPSESRPTGETRPGNLDLNDDSFSSEDELRLIEEADRISRGVDVSAAAGEGRQRPDASAGRRSLVKFSTSTKQV